MSELLEISKGFVSSQVTVSNFAMTAELYTLTACAPSKLLYAPSTTSATALLLIQTKIEFKMEFGDCLYSLLSLAEELNIDAEQYLDKVIAKYRARIEKNGNMGSGR